MAFAQGFDWDALSSRRMEPPRRPKDDDSAKRKAELTETRRADPRQPTATPEELAEWEKVFKASRTATSLVVQHHNSLRSTAAMRAKARVLTCNANITAHAFRGAHVALLLLWHPDEIWTMRLSF